MDPEPDNASSLRTALEPEALRAALIPRRPVFRNPWNSEGDMFSAYLAVSFMIPALLYLGGKLTGSIFDYSERWPLGIFMAAALVGAAGFITVVGRERTRLAVDVLAIAAWLLLGLVIAPVIGLAPSTAVAIVLYAVLLVAILLYVLGFGRWETPFLRTLSWPVIWSSLALFFAYSAHQLVLFA